ncbi:MAG: inositol monophosphatase family protein [Parasphingorhabdus sp.]|uniref:inositol monophosphatase family protein n=1 Tax=Parasphingorhabdus sp. TaxID=2709688 RepID=UPI003297A8DD
MADIDFDRVIAIAVEGGALAMRDWKLGEKADKTWEKSPGQIVSDADLAVDGFLRTELEKLLPSAGWLSEETHIDHSGAGDELTWVVDPIDGTKDFVAGKIGWCVSVALVQNEAPIFGILVAPAKGEIWVAKAGHKSEVNGRTLVASACQQFEGCRVPTEGLPPEINLVPVPKPNSIALRMAMVADDRADFVASTRWGHEWDIAAAHVIAAEAGASVSNALGEKLVYNGTHGKALGVLCCAQDIYDDAVQRIGHYATENGASH